MVALSTKITVASIHIALVRLCFLVELYLGLHLDFVQTLICTRGLDLRTRSVVFTFGSNFGAAKVRNP